MVQQGDISDSLQAHNSDDSSTGLPHLPVTEERNQSSTIATTTTNMSTSGINTTGGHETIADNAGEMFETTIGRIRMMLKVN